MKTNRRMAKMLLSYLVTGARLPEELNRIIESGFREADGCYFIEGLLERSTNVDQASFPDQTGYEVFINKLHIDDYVAEGLLTHAIQAALCLQQNFRLKFASPELRTIIGVEENSCVLVTHAIRRDETWLREPLDDYEEESLLVIDSGDLA